MNFLLLRRPMKNKPKITLHFLWRPFYWTNTTLYMPENFNMRMYRIIITFVMHLFLISQKSVFLRECAFLKLRPNKNTI